MTRFWRVVEDFLASRQAMTGRLSVGRDPSGRLFVRVLGYSVVDEHFRVPTIMLDATGNQTLLRAFWPQVEFRDRYRIEAPNAKFYQIVDKSFAKTSHAPALREPKSPKGKAEERRKAKLRENIAIFAASVQRVHGGAQMVVSNKGTMAAFDRKGRFGVLKGHFCALVGRNNFKHARTGLLFGRGAVPAVRKIEEQAMALTGRVIAPISDNWPVRDAERIVRASDGGYFAVACQAIYHPDPMCQALLGEHAHAEIEQDAHRLRPINRASDDPAIIIIGNDLALPFPIDGVISFDEFENPSERDRMLAEGGIAFDAAKAAVTFYPGMFTSETALAKTLEREAQKIDTRADASAPVSDNPPYLFNTGKCRSLAYLRQPENGLFGEGVTAASVDPSPATLPRVSYANRAEGTLRFSFQRQGEGQRPQTGDFDPIRRPNLCDDIEAVFGPLAHFEIIGDGAATSSQSVKDPTMSRSDYEANSLSRTQPWVAEGISRRTWERRRKKAAENETQIAPSERPRLISSSTPTPASPHGSWLVETRDDDGTLRESFRITRATRFPDLHCAQTDASERTIVVPAGKQRTEGVRRFIPNPVALALIAFTEPTNGWRCVARAAHSRR